MQNKPRSSPEELSLLNYNSKRIKRKDIMHYKEEPSLLGIIYSLIELT